MRLKIRNNKLKNKEYNFLNNQNYILGKTEKKKLLSKFFVEKFIILYNNILSKINKNLPNGLLIYIIIYFFTVIIVPYSLGLSPKNPISGFFFTFFILTLSYFYFKDYKIFKWFKFKYFKKNYFIISKYSYFHLFVKFFIILFSLSYILNFFNINSFITMFILFFTFGLIFLDFIKILLTPFIILSSIFILFYSFIYTFIFKGIKGYKIIKEKPKSKFLEKFTSIDKGYAENKYYKIKIKS